VEVIAERVAAESGDCRKALSMLLQTGRLTETMGRRCRPMIYKTVPTTYVQQVVGYMTKKVNFRLPDELIEKADVAAEISHTNRTEIIKQALQEYLKEVENEDEFREAVVELYLDNEIEFDTLKEFIGRRDAESVRASKSLLDQGEELADELAEL
jgi:predicted transcriptional regulator